MSSEDLMDELFTGYFMVLVTLHLLSVSEQIVV